MVMQLIDNQWNVILKALKTPLFMSFGCRFLSKCGRFWVEKA